LTETDNIKTINKKDNYPNNNYNNSDFFEENEFDVNYYKNKENFNNLKTISNHRGFCSINTLNGLNNVNILIEDVSDIPFDDELINPDEVKDILNSIFMDYAKYNEPENDFLINLQNVITIFKTVNIIHEKIIKYNQFVVILQKLSTKTQKLTFDSFLDIIAKISLKLFTCFDKNPEKCIYFLIKFHFQPIFNKRKIDLLLNNTVKKYSNNGLNNVINNSNEIYSNSLNEKNKSGVFSKSLPPRIDNLTDSKSKYNNTNNDSTKIKANINEKIDLDKNRNFNNLHSNIDNQLNTNLDQQQDKNKNFIEINSNGVLNMSFKDLEQYLRSTNIDMKCKILINSITPTLLVIYKAYFEHEIKRYFIKTDYIKKSSESLFSFCKDFFIVPNYLSYNFISNYYKITSGDSNALESLMSHEEFSKEGFFKIKDFQNDKEVSKGFYFTFYKFCIFIIHIGVLVFPKIQKNFKEEKMKKYNSKINGNSTITKAYTEEYKDNLNSDDYKDTMKQNCSISEKSLIFMEYLEESKGLINAEKRLTRINNSQLTFIPALEVINIIKHNNEGVKLTKTFRAITENCNESFDTNEQKKEEQENLTLFKSKSGINSNIRSFLNPAITEKTAIKLEYWLPKLKSIFTYYITNFEKSSSETMNFSCFLKLLRDAQIIINNKKNGLNLTMEKSDEEDDEKVFKSRILGDCIVPKKVETLVTFKRYDEKLAHKIEKSHDHTITSHNMNNTAMNKSLISNNGLKVNEENSKDRNEKVRNNNSFINKNVNSDRIDKSRSPDMKLSVNGDKEVNSINIDNSFLGDSIDFSINNNTQFNHNNLNNSNLVSENNFLNTNNNIHNIDANNYMNQNNVCYVKKGIINENLGNKKFSENFNQTKKISNLDVSKQGIQENDVSLIFSSLVGKKDYNFKNTNLLQSKLSAENNFDSQIGKPKEKSINILKSKKLSFNLFIKSLEQISFKLYGSALKAKQENKNPGAYIDQSFELFIEKNIPLIFDNFLNKNENTHKLKVSENTFDHLLDILRNEKNVNLIL